MGHLRRSLMLSVGGYLLKRAWGRKLALNVTEEVVGTVAKEKLRDIKEAFHDAFHPGERRLPPMGPAETLLSPVYFVVGLLLARADAAHPAAAPARGESAERQSA